MFIYTTTLKNLEKMKKKGELNEYDEIIIAMQFKPESVEFGGNVVHKICLSPPKKLLIEWLTGMLIWKKYVDKFRSAKQFDFTYSIELRRIIRQIKLKKKILIVCKCENYDRCHRSIVCDDMKTISSGEIINKEL